jgi:hypothetical protein
MTANIEPAIMTNTSAVIEFDIPEEENPEPGQPISIAHGCDYMLLPDGGLEFYYNFLVYTWQLGEEEISARAYFDDIKMVSVFVEGARLRNETALQPVVRYLQRRYELIQSFHARDAKDGGTGYVMQYSARK